MAYNAQYDLRGKRIQDTYTQVVQYDTSSGAVYTGQGSSIDNFSSSFARTSSFASTAAFANNATSASYAPSSPNVSASYAAQADHATLAAGLDEGAFGASSSLYGPFLSGEVSIDGVTTQRGLYLDQYSVIKASQMSHLDMDYCAGITSSVQGQLDNMRTGSGVDTASYVNSASYARTIDPVQINPSLTLSSSNNVFTLYLKGDPNTGGKTSTLTSNPAGLVVAAEAGSTIMVSNDISMPSRTITANSFVGTASFASQSLSASWAPGDGSGTLLTTGSTYQITSSWAVNVVNGANQVSVSWASSSLRLSNASASIGTNGRAGFGKQAGSSFVEIQGDGNDSWITAFGSSSTSQFFASEDGVGGAYVQVNDAATNYFSVLTTKDLTASLDLNSALTESRIFLNSKGNSYFLNEGNVGIGTTDPTSKLHVVGEITSSALRIPYTENGSGVTVGGIDIQTNDNTNGSVGWNSLTIDGGTTWVKKDAGSSGLIHVSAPSLYIQMSPSDVSGSPSITATQFRVNGLDNTVALGGNIGTGFSYGNPVMLVSGSNRVTVSGSISASLGFTGSLFGTASYAQTASIATTSSYAAITVQGNGSSLDQYIPFVSNSGSVDKLFVDNTNDLKYNPVDGLLTVTHISASCITGSSSPAGYVSFLGTASWTQNVTSASYAETTKTASFLNGLATGSAGAGYASFYGTASWALNTVNGGGGGSAGTQSSVDVSMKDMQFPFTAAFAGITPALLNGSSFDNNNFNRTGNGSVNGLVFWYLTFRNENIAGGNEVGSGLTASIAFHQMRAPVNYNPAGGITHSFQYFAMGTVDAGYSPIEGEIPGANDKVYWNVDLFALTASTDPTSNFFSTPKLCGTNVVTKSFSGAIHESGSMETITSMFSDAYLSTDCMFFINVKRINSDSSSVYDPGTPVGDRTDYTGSVAMVSSRVSYNTM